MTIAWERTIRNGNVQLDQQELSMVQQHAAQQGLRLEQSALPGGGIHVRAIAGAPTPLQQPMPQPMPQPMQQPQGVDRNALAARNQDRLAAARNDPRFAAIDAANAARDAQPALGRPHGDCQLCGVRAETKKVTLVQNVGVVVMRFQRILTAELCRTCIRRNFWKMTTIMFFFGWWGIISFVFTVIGIPANIVQYCRTFGMQKPAAQ